MAPLVPRMHLFEIDDQPWFPPFLRARVQDALTASWTSKTPLQPQSAASLAASVLIRELGNDLSSYKFIDFCSGGGGPTPSIERVINAKLRERNEEPVDFVLTDLHPNVTAWDLVVRKSPNIMYHNDPVNAAKAPQELISRQDGKKVMRLFNLAFHHFDDPLASQILKDTVETSDGFAIFELQDRTLEIVLSMLMFGTAIMLAAPFYAWKWRSPATLFFTWVIPILPFVIVFDGFMSAMRTRTPEEVESLLRGCGADTSLWEVRSGRQMFVYPWGYMNWIVCKPIKEQE
ncbi:hypothetical protein PT974_03599 [Cladobotryum mycophilum]|uniref:Uncharacterized protein n=1 Tax=Cladobotryum mycophilum TaxID=491253 RepID=A0ABR0SSS1_9HYPO